MQENLFKYIDKGLQGEKNIKLQEKSLALVPSLYDGSVALSVRGLGKRGIKATLSLLKHEGVE